MGVQVRCHTGIWATGRSFRGRRRDHFPKTIEDSIDAENAETYRFLFAGLGVFAGAFFTAPDDSFTAGAISFIRTMFFQIGTVLIMPLFLDIDGIRYAPMVAEMLAFATSIIYLKRKKGRYHY